MFETQSNVGKSQQSEKVKHGWPANAQLLPPSSSSSGGGGGGGGKATAFAQQSIQVWDPAGQLTPAVFPQWLHVYELQSLGTSQLRMVPCASPIQCAPLTVCTVKALSLVKLNPEPSLNTL